MAGVVDCSKLDITNISEDNILVIGDKAWIKAQVEEKIYYYYNHPCAIIKFDDACYARLCNDLDPIPKELLNVVDNLALKDPCGGGGGGAGGGDGGGEGEGEGGGSSDPCSGDCSENPDCSNYTPGGCGEGGGGESEPASPGVDPNAGGSDRKAETIRPKNEEQKKGMKEARDAVDLRAMNRWGFQGTAVTPSVAVVPLVSNLQTYGPYASSNFGVSCGGTQVQGNSELAPWVFGSVAGMNSAGASLVENAAIGLVKAETGSITIPGMPINTFTYLGSVLGSGGATLSSMNFSFGSGGVSTTYEFKTYTPKFGSLNRHLIDRIKDASKYRSEQLRFLRNNQITLNKIGRKISRFNRRFPRNNGGTLQRVLVAETLDWQKGGQCSIVGIDTLYGSNEEMVYNYKNKAYMSLDALFSPVSKKGSGSLPRYTSFETRCHKSSSDEAQPPFKIDDNQTNTGTGGGESGETGTTSTDLDQYNLDISQTYLDPLTNKIVANEHHHDGEGRGHVIDLVGRNDEVPEKTLITNFYHLDDPKRYSEDYRFLSMKGPLMLQSWGYDTQGKPIPNESDDPDATSSGTFVKENLKDAFLKDWLAKPKTWPVAPVDFRFDRKRGVWVSPPGYRVVVAQLMESLDPYGSADAKLINKDTQHDKEFGPTLYDKDGQEVKATDEADSKAIITVVDRIGAKYNSGTKVYCYYDTFKCEYIILEAKQPNSIRFKIIDLCEDYPVQADYGDEWTKYAGYGDKFPNNHILGIRIDCEGNPVDKNGNTINQDDIADVEKRPNILVNLYDTCGQHGPAYAQYDLNNGQEAFNEWKQNAATGFGLICSPTPSGACALGEGSTQCSSMNPEYDSYDIVFLDTYARFVECTLTQKLYVDDETASEEYYEDQYKIDHPNANAAADIEYFYGNSPNGKEPKFFKDDLEQIEFRVFDPFENFPKHKNPFIKLDKGDKVLAVFDENRKKYVIYNALQNDDKVIKFALVDNKDQKTSQVRAVLVDHEGNPIAEDGTKLTAVNFADNFITVYDSLSSNGSYNPTPSYHNFLTTGFGPALGSDSFDEHMNGIELHGGDQTPPPKPNGESSSTWTGGPFTGYALQRRFKTESESEENVKNEIFFLESFAHTIRGKIATKKPVIDNTFYLGVLRLFNFVDGRIPFTRTPIAEDPDLNLRINFPLDQHAAGKYIIGDWYDQRIQGDAWNSVDGCNFLAVLDNGFSKVTGGEEKLYYSIVEVENVANRGKTVIIDKDKANELNAGEVQENVDEGYVHSEYLDGFMWNKEKSKTNYNKTKIINRDDWVAKALIPKITNTNSKHIRTSLAGYDTEYNILTYRVDYAGTIAQIGDGRLNMSEAGKFGQPGELAKQDKLITNLTGAVFYHGLSPLSPTLGLGEEGSPIVDVTHNWMTYQNAPIAAAWDESTGGSKIEDGKYRVIYAREAPVIITGTASEDFKPSKQNNITVQLDANVAYASCPGFDKNPVTVLLTKVENPMGYGAQKNDLVTIQRVFLQNAQQNNANYKYIVIGTGKPPESC